MVIKHAEAPTFNRDGTDVTGYASASRGARDTGVWRLTLAPGAASPPHSLSREEVFLALSGSAEATIGDERHALDAGDCLIVPAGEPFAIATRGDQPFEAVVCMPVGGEATILPDGPTITPPWAA
jgi:mannose-6-phosphate isomerase-like protein (cupin superfamily)